MQTLPRVFLKPRRAQPFFHRHPWVFATAIARIEGDPAPGDEVILNDVDGRFIARGLYNPRSHIRLRLYTWNPEQPLDEAFWSQRLDEAIGLRRRLFPARDDQAASACRLVYSEADRLSGLIVDRYDRWLLVQFTSLALSRRSELLVQLLQEKLQPAGIRLRTEKGIREREGLERRDGLIAGDEPPRPLFIEEHGIRYGIDVAEGQKTGFYLDQRDNRAVAAGYVDGGRVLDLFCYSGGFGLTAAKIGRAEQVVGIDVSERALLLARSNAELNNVSHRCRFEKAKVFDALERMAADGERFDCVILDPPKLAHRRSGLQQALRGYHSLNRLAISVLNPEGILVSCSCSGLVSRDDFETVLADVALRGGRHIQILEARGSSADHPTSVHCAETNYLKCYICRVV